MFEDVSLLSDTGGRKININEMESESEGTCCGKIVCKNAFCGCGEPYYAKSDYSEDNNSRRCDPFCAACVALSFCLLFSQPNEKK